MSAFDMRSRLWVSLLDPTDVGVVLPPTSTTPGT
jgi:hypothetical protein